MPGAQAHVRLFSTLCTYEGNQHCFIASLTERARREIEIIQDTRSITNCEAAKPLISTISIIYHGIIGTQSRECRSHHISTYILHIKYRFPPKTLGNDLLRLNERSDGALDFQTYRLLMQEKLDPPAEGKSMK